jgi:hypothetical protein
MPDRGEREGRYRAALEAIANAEIPGVSGGPNGASREVIGSGHVCEAVKECEGTCCDARGTFLVAEADKTAYFVCADHVDGRAIVGCQPGVPSAQHGEETGK